MTESILTGRYYFKPASHGIKEIKTLILFISEQYIDKGNSLWFKRLSVMVVIEFENDVIIEYNHLRMFD